MRWHSCLTIAAVLLSGFAAAVHGEQIKYYMWTDEDGVIHAGDTPPRDRDYETRIIEVDANVIPSPEPVAGSRASSTSTGTRQDSRSSTTVGISPGNTGAAIAEEEQRRIDEGIDDGFGGADTAPGADTAASGAAAPASGAASPGATAPGAATAPSAPFVPPVIPGP